MSAVSEGLKPFIKPLFTTLKLLLQDHISCGCFQNVYRAVSQRKFIHLLLNVNKLPLTTEDLLLIPSIVTLTMGLAKVNTVQLQSGYDAK